MKKNSPVTVAQAVFGLLLSGSRTSDAGMESFKVPYGAVNFVVHRYDDGRNHPYVITFTDFELLSVFEFDKAGSVTVIEANEELYNPNYRTNTNLRQMQRDYARPPMANRNTKVGGEETGREAIYDYESNDKVNQEKPSYGNLRQPSHNDERSAAPRGRELPALQPLDRAYSRRQLVNHIVKAEERNADPAWDEYTLFEHQTAHFGHDIDADSDQLRPWRMDQARVGGGGGGDTIVGIAMPFSHVATTLRRDADAAWGAPRPSSMRPSRAGGGDTDADAGMTTFFGRVDDAERDNSSLSGMDLEEHRLTDTRHGPSKCEGCQQTWDTLCDNGVNTACSIRDADDQVLPGAIEESINMLCVGFVALCSELAAFDVCDEKCEEGQDHEEREETEQEQQQEQQHEQEQEQEHEVDRQQGQEHEECLPPLTITFEWTALSELQPDEYDGLGFVDMYVIEPQGQMAYWKNTETNTGYLTSTDNKASYTLLSGLSGKRATGTYIAYAELRFGSHPVSWTATATTGSGEVLYVEKGVFTGGRVPSSTSTRDIAREGMFLHGTSRRMYADLAEYVDNGCKDHNVDIIDYVIDNIPNLMVW